MKPFQETFADQGYLHLKGYFGDAQVESLEQAIVDIFAMQAGKIGEYRDDVHAITGSLCTRRTKLTGILDLLEAKDKEAAYQAQKFLAKSQSVRSFFDKGFVQLCADMIGCDSRTTLIDGPALFVNKPSVSRLLYRWHTEALYYPKRRRFLNCWLPILGDRTPENGAMSVMPTSHKRVWDASMMLEYSGWTKEDEGKRNQFVQLEIPENFLTEYSRADCTSSPGDAILFDRNLMHTSNPNTSSETSFAIVARVWNPCDDLTLSGEMECTPYKGGNIGRANLVVRP